MRSCFNFALRQFNTKSSLQKWSGCHRTNVAIWRYDWALLRCCVLNYSLRRERHQICLRSLLVKCSTNAESAMVNACSSLTLLMMQIYIVVHFNLALCAHSRVVLIIHSNSCWTSLELTHLRSLNRVMMNIIVLRYIYFRKRRFLISHCILALRALSWNILGLVLMAAWLWQVWIPWWNFGSSLELIDWLENRIDVCWHRHNLLYRSHSVLALSFNHVLYVLRLSNMRVGLSQALRLLILHGCFSKSDISYFKVRFSHPNSLRAVTWWV